jgi:hypothetical protein
MTRAMCAVAAMALVAAPVMAQDKAVDVMQKARAALGGARLEQVKALALEGPFAREMGNRQVQGKLELTLQLPGNMHRSEDTEMMGGMSIERVAALSGDTAWEDIQNRGGMGGGMQMVIRQGPPGQELNAEQIEQARVRRLKTEFNRYMLAFLGGAGLQPTFVAVAEAPEGKADVVEVKNEQGQSVRLFIDQATSMPLMLQYQEIRPRIMMGGPGGGPGGPGGRRGPGSAPGGDAPGARAPGGAGAPGAPGAPGAAGGAPNPEEIRRRMESMPPPQPSTVTLYLGEFKTVDGVMLPHRLTQAIDGKTVEEWTIEKARVNPTIKADLFEKK